MLKHLKEHSFFIFVFFACALLRFWPLFEYQYTYDELSGLERTRFDSFSDLVNNGVKIDAHPVLIQLLIFCIVKLFGYSAWLVKLPFLLLGQGAVYYAYLLGRRHFSKQTGMLLAVFLAFSLVFVFYAPIARMYVSGIFFSLGLLYYFFEIVFSDNTSRRNYFLFALFALLSALNHHINSLFAVTVYVSGIVLTKKENLKHYLITGTLTVIAYLPHLSISLYQLGVGGIGINQGGWLDKPSVTAVIDFVKIILGTGNLYVLVVVFALWACVASKNFLPNKKQIFLLIIFLINYFVVYFYSVYRAPIYQHSVMLFSGIAFLLFALSWLQFKDKQIANLVLLSIAGALIYKTYFKKDYLHQCVKTSYHYQFERTQYYKLKHGGETVYPIYFDADDNMKTIYFDELKTNFPCTISTDSVCQSTRIFSKFVSELKSNYLVLCSALPAQQAIARHYFPYLIENTQTQAINFKLYSKLPIHKNEQVNDDAVILHSTPLEPNVFQYSKKLPVLIDSLMEFPFETLSNYQQALAKEGSVLLISANLKYHHVLQQGMEICMTVNDDEKNTYAYAARSAKDVVMQSDSIVSIYTDYYAGTSHARIPANARLGCYVWNRYKEKATLHDFDIKVIDYWPKKWQFWE